MGGGAAPPVVQAAVVTPQPLVATAVPAALAPSAPPLAVAMPYPAAAAAPNAATPVVAAAVPVDQAKVARLVEMGFDAESARQALAMANGNVELAAARLAG
mmetsp:Transcript_93653/g.291581  ORF Transcript_93653/g.291581 Transcript_93653/m.291581 type:complete len:101 (+) Transcript_93653:1-303(+)